MIFMECDTCRAKSGSPTLCVGCLHNRAKIDALVVLLKECGRGSHSKGYNEESADYPPCPLSYEDAKSDAKCTCGAEEWNAKVDTLLTEER